MESAPKQTVWQKYWVILSSPRFHQILIAFIVQALSHYGKIDAWMANALTVMLAGSVTVNTVDRFSQVPPPAPGS